MIVLSILFILFVYALLSVLVINASGKIANWLGYDPKLIKKRIKILWFAPVLIWLVWDLPTIPLHKYYCATQAGFFVYKTPEQWLKEHPEVTREDLRLVGEMDHKGRYRPLYAPIDKSLWGQKNRHVAKVDWFNGRIYQNSSYTKNFTTIFPVHKQRTVIADIANNQTLAEWVSFSSGYGNPIQNGNANGWKAWLANSRCTNSTPVPPVNQVNFMSSLIKLRK